nr:UDP-N-acetylmuramate--L-alanine ligase [Lachnospiraceae bacterium]
DYFVAEACEYTDSFLQFFPRISVVLNIEEDHLDYFADIHAIRRSFRHFMELLPEDGTLIINGDIPQLNELTDGLRCHVVTFGSGSASDYSPADISFDENGCGHYRLQHAGENCSVSLGVVGMHNILNSLATLAVTDVLGVSRDTSLEALAAFRGAARRFEFKGKLGGITVMDDYAHHPTEIRATLTAAQNYPHKKLRLVFQPHTYTRTKAFLSEFAEVLAMADEVILADIYAAREKNTIGISSKDLQEQMRKNGKEALYFPYFDDIETWLLTHAEDGDLILTMGAGDIYKVGEKLLGA